MTRRLPTSYEVARLAGVSQSAVSRAFTPGASVSRDTRAKVEAAAAALGYMPSVIPRIMLTGRSGIVALIVSAFHNPYYAMALEALTRALRAAGLKTMLVQVDGDEALDAAVGALAGYRVDGVVSALGVVSADVAEALSAYRIPIITLNLSVASAFIRTVASDNRGAGAEAARLLHGRGARRFAFVGAPDIPTQAERGEGFAAGLAELGVGAHIRRPGDSSHGGGYRAALALLQEGARPEAIFCANDLTAMGVADALRLEGGLKIGEDVMIVGYDNIAAAAWPSYALTTFDQRLDEMAARAVALLECKPGEGPVLETCAPLLVERASTRGG